VSPLAKVQFDGLPIAQILKNTYLTKKRRELEFEELISSDERFLLILCVFEFSKLPYSPRLKNLTFLEKKT
jgi:hypothetical protein